MGRYRGSLNTVYNDGEIAAIVHKGRRTRTYIPRTPKLFPRKGPLLVHPLRTLFALSFMDFPSGFLSPSVSPHKPPIDSPEKQVKSHEYM